MTKTDIKRRRLHGSGCKATPQRMSILQAIDGMPSQFTPQELYEHLQQTHPDIGLVTVYRTLKLLTQSGMVCRMAQNGRAQSYASHPQEHHHHLVCTGCNKVVDIAACSLKNMEKQLARETGFAISDHHLEFTGLCRRCQTLSSGVPT